MSKRCFVVFSSVLLGGFVSFLSMSACAEYHTLILHNDTNTGIEVQRISKEIFNVCGPNESNASSRCPKYTGCGVYTLHTKICSGNTVIRFCRAGVDCSKTYNSIAEFTIDLKKGETCRTTATYKNGLFHFTTPACQN